jgi:hypothetical protein
MVLLEVRSDTTSTVPNAPPGVLDECSCRLRRHVLGRRRRAAQATSSTASPGCDRDLRRRHAGEGHDVRTRVGLFDVATPRRHQRRAPACGEVIGGVIEADELGRSLRVSPDLRSEPGTAAACSSTRRRRRAPRRVPAVAGDEFDLRQAELRVVSTPCSCPRARAASAIANRSSRDISAHSAPGSARRRGRRGRRALPPRQPSSQSSASHRVRHDRRRHQRLAPAQATWSTASHAAVATPVGVMPAKAITSRWRCD